MDKLGHKPEIFVLNETTDKRKLLNFDFVTFSRHYNQPQLHELVYFLKAHGVPIVYEIDDDLELLLNMNNDPTGQITPNKNSIHLLANNCDMITTSTPYLANLLELRYHKHAEHVYNSLDFATFTRRTSDNERLRVGWAGGSTHFPDLLIILDVIKDLQEKYDFDFFVQGLSFQPLDALFFVWRKSVEFGFQKLEPWMEQAFLAEDKLKKLKRYTFIPFYPSGMYSNVMSGLKLDIGLAPLRDSSFNKSKSCLKYYEYAALGAATIASDVMPYTEEVSFRVKNTYQDWYENIEMLLVDKKKRQDIQEEQFNWVKNNRDMSKTVKRWEEVFSMVCRKR
jgi:glycosyltransferase involved in cell wall biosynthesis